MSRCAFFALVCAVAGLLTTACVGADRVALVVGNARYAGAAILQNPGNDADAMETALKDLGFTVLKKKDLSLPQMEEAVLAFRRSLSKGSLGLFFYAGHGVQVKGENFLVPIGAQPREEYEVKRQCLPMAQVLDAMAEAESNLKVVVLDCCRDNPFKRSWSRGAAGNGLASVSNVPEGTIIAFATSPDHTADDGGRRDHSPYTSHLLAVLHSRPADGLELSEVFREASRAVKRETGQVPWMNLEASLEKYYLWKNVSAMSGSGPSLPGPPPPGSSGERTFTNTAGMKMVLVPAGEFMMGSSPEEIKLWNDWFKQQDLKSSNVDNEGPQHRVRITRPYYLGAHHVTVGQFRKFVTDVGYQTDAEKGEK